MLFLTHLFFAQEYATQNDIPITPEFNLGAVLPDIRYISEIRREQTHFRPSVVAQKVRTPDDFILGYKLHLLLDAFVVAKNVRSRMANSFPWLIRRRISPRVANMLCEIYCLEKYRQLNEIVFSHTYRDDFRHLSMTRHDFNAFIEAISHIAHELTMQSVEDVVLSNEALRNNPKVQKYKNIGKLLTSNSLISTLISRKIGALMPKYIEEYLEYCSDHLEIEQEATYNGY